MQVKLIRGLGRWAATYKLAQHHGPGRSDKRCVVGNIRCRTWCGYEHRFRQVWAVIDETTRNGRLIIVNGTRMLNRRGYRNHRNAVGRSGPG